MRRLKLLPAVAFALLATLIPTNVFADKIDNNDILSEVITTQTIYDEDGNEYGVVCEKIYDTGENDFDIQLLSPESESVEHLRYTLYRSGGDNHVFLDPSDTGYIGRVDLTCTYKSREVDGFADGEKLLTKVSWSWSVVDTSFSVSSAEVFYCCKQEYKKTIDVTRRNNSSQLTNFSVYGSSNTDSIGSWICVKWKQGSRVVESELVCNIGGTLSVGGRYG